ncbi:hypothetical protein VNO80_34891 [Phaseolus coccineus]|uniref:DNA topoisomerase n=1 Tax=Phaseolus coccineus TaxID=3886 RepID=A0AAN9KSU4_PHACN
MSAQNLVIVESKNKVSKVQTYLDQLYGKSSFIVSYSSGHIHDDREGEAIAWHLQTVLKCKERAFRVAFNEITKAALKSTFDNPRSLNMKIVAAQEARRFLDRIIGYVGTPVFTVLCGERQIAGRVQSSIVVYLADLERQIQSFVSVHHFGVSFLFDEWTANWETENFVEKSNPYFMDREIAEKIALLKNFNVISFEEKPVKSSPPAPFTTPTYLRAAQVQCKLKPKEAMKIAQKLFEDGHITYHRTDSPNISDDAFSMIQAFALKHKLPVLAQWQVKWKKQPILQDRKCQSALVLLTGASQKTYFKCSNLACGHNMKNENGKAIDKEDNVTPFNCVECSKSLIIMNGAKGKFFGCSGFFNKRNKCRASYPMLENGEPDFAQYAKRKEQLGSQSIGSVDTSKTNVATVSSKSKDHTCPECNKTLSQKTGKRSTDGKKWEMWIYEVIKASEKRVNEMIERIATGQSTFEEEDDRLMAEWERNNQEDK